MSKVCNLPTCGHTNDTKTKLKKCSACKTVYYCGDDHQRQDWPAHKSACKAFREARERADTNVVRDAAMENLIEEHGSRDAAMENLQMMTTDVLDYVQSSPLLGTKEEKKQALRDLVELHRSPSMEDFKNMINKSCWMKTPNGQNVLAAGANQAKHAEWRNFYNSVLTIIKEQEREAKRKKKKDKKAGTKTNAKDTAKDKGKSSRVASSSRLPAACRLTLEKLETQPKNGPLLDENWRCRKCGGLAADHPSVTM